MGPSYRAQVAAAIGRVLPVAEFRDLDRRSRDRWGWYPLAVAWLLQTVSRGADLGERFADARGWLRRLVPTARLGRTYQGFVKAVRRRGDVLGLWVRAAFQDRMRQWLGDDDRVGGWRPLAVDGTRFACPRSRSCQRAFRRAGRDKGPPEVGLTALWHLGVHCFWDARVAPATVSERTLLRQMLDGLPPRALLVGDAGFVGYDLCAELIRRGVGFLLRVGGNVELLTGLGVMTRETADTVYLWPQTHRGTPPVVLRLIVVGTGRRRVYLVTNVQARTALPRKLAAEFYRRRWGIETAYRAVKQTLARRTLRSRAADLALHEVVGIVLASWMLALMGLLARGRRALRAVLAPAALARTLRHALDRLGRRGPSLWRRLGRAVAPSPTHRRRKVRQAWPTKKNDPPCAAPTVRRAPAALIQKAQRVRAKAA
jgi:Transposase DDE domain